MMIVALYAATKNAPVGLAAAGMQSIKQIFMDTGSYRYYVAENK